MCLHKCVYIDFICDYLGCWWVFFLVFFCFVAFNVIRGANSSYEKTMWWVTQRQIPVSNPQSLTSVKQSLSNKSGKTLEW